MPSDRQPLEAVPPKGLSRIATAAAFAVVAAVAVGYILLRPAPDPPESLTASAAATPPTTVPAAPAKKSENGGQDSLKGRWARTDGDYALEIRSAASDGKLDAGYFNPKSINVARAEWKTKGGNLFVLVELRDENYPGSTYTLQYFESDDRLIGIYFQAMENLKFEVEFTRQK